MLNQMETEYLRACNDCAAACLQCATLCLKEADPKPMVNCILLDMECADMCRHTAQAIARGDSHLHTISILCADICEKCASQCGMHKMDHCQQWATISKSGYTVRAHQAKASVNNRLVMRDTQIIKLLDLPFDHSDLEPDYIKGYVPGVRENGGQYTQAAAAGHGTLARQVGCIV